MFLGKYLSALDDERRLSVPAALRAELSGAHYITQGFDRNLLILTTSAFEEIYRRVTSLNIADPLARLLLRLILGTARELAADSQGQITIPDELRTFAGLQENVFLIGQGDYLELWSPDLWSTQEVQLRDAETNAARFAMLTVSTR